MVDYRDTISGLTNISWQYGIWQACESYLSPLGNDNFYKAQEGYLGIKRVIHLRQFDNFTNNFITALKVVSYITVVLPAIALIVKLGYRSWYADRLIILENNFPLSGSRFASINPTVDSPINSTVGYPINPVSVFQSGVYGSAVREPVAEPLKNLVCHSFKEIIENPNLSREEEETSLTCSLLLEEPYEYKPDERSLALNKISQDYESKKTKQPVFVIEDGETYSLADAEFIKKQIIAHGSYSGRAGLTLKVSEVEKISEVEEDIYYYNIGHLEQMRRDDQGIIFWIDPITGAKLGEEGFTEPYFCPKDGRTYNFKTFKEYCEQYRLVHPGEEIPSPVDQSIKLGEFVKVYPNRCLFSRTGLNNQPKVEDKLENNARVI